MTDAGLFGFEPTPVIRPNHSVASAKAGNLAAAFLALAALAEPLADYQPCHVEAVAAYARAIAFATSPAGHAFLEQRRSAL